MQSPMQEFRFKAYALIGELDLNRLATRLGIQRKYRWEEPMKLNPLTFSPAVAEDSQQVYLYYFGGIVFFNCSTDLIARFIDSIPQCADLLKVQPQLPFQEEYRLEINPEGEPVIANDCAVMTGYDLAFLDIICFVIAKSVALERIEERVDVVFDDTTSGGPQANPDSGFTVAENSSLTIAASSLLAAHQNEGTSNALGASCCGWTAFGLKDSDSRCAVR